MAYVSTSPTASRSAQYTSSQQVGMAPIQHHRRPISRHNWTAHLARDLHNFVLQLLPTPEEMAVKEDVRKLLERLIRTIEPESRLLSFGSTANGFSLRNSDMDLCCLIDSNRPPLNASDLVTMVGDLLERETKFQVKTLPHARIPIVKLSLDPSPGLPYGISCDIGFENRLALENTRLLLSYASVDPVRVRTLVIFLKVWSKRRKINSPYSGTLSSYGYVLLVIYFLVHVKNPPVLPNLQQMPPLRPISHEDMHIGEHNIWFFDDIELLRQRWQSSNTESVAELLIDFFKYYSRDFSYNTGVASIRGGLLKKSSKGWLNDFKDGRYNDLARARNRLCIEDPFETDYNVARCVTKDGLYIIRGEFMRASRILSARPERTIIALAQLCEERETEFTRPLAPQPFIPPRLTPIPTQTPYNVGNNTPRPNGAQDRLSPPPQTYESTSDATQSPTEATVPQTGDPPEHMAPKRGKWTSPPPPDDPDHSAFEDRLGIGLSLATSSTAARQAEASHGSSSSNSEVLTDEDAHDVADAESVGSVTSVDGQPAIRPKRPLSFFGPSDDEPGWLVVSTPKATNEPLLPRGRAPLRFGFTDSSDGVYPVKSHPRQATEVISGDVRTDSPRRSSSGPPAPSVRLPAAELSTLSLSSPSQHSPSYATIPQVENKPCENETPSAASFPGPTFVRTPFPLYQQSIVGQTQHIRHGSQSSISMTVSSNALTNSTLAVGSQSPTSFSGRPQPWKMGAGKDKNSDHSNGHPHVEHSPLDSSPLGPKIFDAAASLSSRTPTSNCESPVSINFSSENQAASSPAETHSPSHRMDSTQGISPTFNLDMEDKFTASMARLSLTNTKGR